MKKQTILALLLGSLVLAACSTTTLKSSPVAKIDGLNHICIKDSASPKLPQFTQLIAENLKQRQIASDIQVELSDKCHYALAYSLNTQDNLISSAKLRLSSIIDSSRKNLGEVSYWFKGDEEKAKVAKTGLKGQVDTLVNELLKNN